jgi:tetratricopeptide (TPR) repeat protein
MTVLQIALQDDLDRSFQVAREAEEVATAALGAAEIRRARLMVSMARAWGDPTFISSPLRVEADEAVVAFTASGDTEGVLDAHAVRVLIELQAARWRACAAAAQDGLEVAAAAGLARRRDAFAGSLANATLWGPDDARAGIATIEAALGSTDRRLTRSTMLSTVGTLRAVLDDRAAAMAALDESAAIRTELGLGTAKFRDTYAMYALADLPAALEVAREEIGRLAARGETGNRSTLHGIVAVILARQGHDALALEEAAEAGALGQTDDAVTHLFLRVASGIVHARRGELAEADRLTREAIAIAEQTDFLEAASAWVARAIALVALDRRDEAAAAAGHARQLYAQKGHVNALRWVDSLGLG